MVSKRKAFFPAIPAGRELWVVNRQLKAHFRISLAYLLGHLLNLLALAAIFARTLPALPLSIWSILVVTNLGHRAGIWRRNMHAEEKGSPDAELRSIEINTITCAGLFGIGLLWMFTHADQDQRIFVAIAATALVSAAGLTLRTLPRAALGYIGILTLASLVALIGTGSFELLGAAILLLSSACLVARSTLNAFYNFVVRILHDRELAATNETIKLLLNDYEDSGASWLFETDSAGRLMPASERFAEALDLPLSALYRTRFSSLFKASPERNQLEDMIAEGLGFRDFVVPLLIGTEQHWWSITGRPTAGENGKRLRGVITDITAARKAEERATHMAQFDSLTDLPNRGRFQRSLSRTLQTNIESFATAILLVDIDNFKLVNDGYGHDVGDKVLKSFGSRLQTVVARSEHAGEGCVVARLGGDEFAVLIAGEEALESSQALASEIIEAFDDVLTCGKHQLRVECSIGTAASPTDGERPELLQRNAGLALRVSKRDGRNRATRFDTSMDVEAQKRIELERDLRAALVKDELRLFVQPLVEAESGNKVGFEALLRWEQSERGLVMPDEFISIAEETGLIVPIGAWVLRTAIAEAARWTEPLSVAVNISPIQMRNPESLLATIIHALAETGLDPARLELEITESVLINDIDSNLALLHKIRALGVRIALDDFGTGYSSLSYLRTFPFDKIKIDRCFVSEIENRPDCRAIVSAVINLAKDLGMVTTAEGVEDEAQRAELAREGCTQLQGFLFGKPAPVSSLTNLHLDLKNLDDGQAFHRRAA